VSRRSLGEGGLCPIPPSCILSSAVTTSFLNYDHRRHFASDNNAGVCPEVWSALQEANAGHLGAYGNDAITEQAQKAFCELFETDCETFFVSGGTAANGLAIGSFCERHHGVICHRYSHIETDECNAAGFLNPGLKVVPVDGENGKINVPAVDEAFLGLREVHSSQPRLLTLTNATELGTLYWPAEIAALAESCKQHGLALHVDGARFANAVASAGCTPADLTWKAGVDVLVFGGTKNGLAFGEAIVFFDRSSSKEFLYRMKQSGQLTSKMRFLAAQWLGLLANGRWLNYAQHANAMAERLAKQLANIPAVKVLFPCEANAVFATIPADIVDRLHERGWRFYTDVGPGGGARLMCSWDTAEEDVDQFVNDLKDART
jgi:threonine aldolase